MGESKIGKTEKKAKKDKKINFAGTAYRSFLAWGICSSLSTTVCTIVDALLVGTLVGSDGLTVTNIATPVYLIYALFGVTVGIGANVGIARCLGADDREGANRMFSSALTVGLVLALVCLSPLLFRDTYYSFLGVTDELYLLADRYLRVVLWSAPVFVFYHILSASVKTDGDPKLAALASAAVILANLSLDFIFIKGLNMGILGASASLCTAETLGVLILLSHFLKKHNLLKLKPAIPKLRDIANFVWEGFSSGSAFIFSSVVMLVFNNRLLGFGGADGRLYVAIYGVLYTVGTIPGGIYEGTSVALSTVTPFLVGESDTEGIDMVAKRALKIALFVGIALGTVGILLPGQITGLFGIDSPRAAAAMRVFALCSLPIGINTVITSFWQSIGRAKLANSLSVLRNFALILTSGLLLIPKFNVLGVSLAYLTTELVCLLFVLGVMMISPSKKYVGSHYSHDDSTGRLFECDYPIKTESMEKISSDLEEICDGWEIGPKQAFLINFVCEELLLNIIKYALDGDGGKGGFFVSVKLMEKGGDYVLCVRDNVRLYNPFESEGDSIDSGVLNLIKKKAKKCEYQRKLVFNYLYLVI